MFEKVVVLCGGGEEGKRAMKGKGLVSPLLNHAGSIISDQSECGILKQAAEISPKLAASSNSEISGS